MKDGFLEQIINSSYVELYASNLAIKKSHKIQSKALNQSVNKGPYEPLLSRFYLHFSIIAFKSIVY